MNTQLTISPCPHLGLADDPTLSRTAPDEAHRCYAQDPPAEIDVEYQRAHCLAAEHSNCSFYFPPSPQSQPAYEAEEGTRTWQMVYLGSVALILLIVAIVYGRTLLFPPSIPATATSITLEASATASPSPTLVPAPLSPAALPELSTPTPEPGGRNLTLVPSAGNVAWWSSGDARRSHAGDSFLYAGYFQGQAFVAALQLDLSRVPRGAPIHAAMLRLTGLRDDRFDPAAGGNWNLSILSPTAIDSLARTDFQTLFNAPAAITLVPSLVAGDLQPHRLNTWQLDASALDWLEQQLLDGVTTLTLRIIGPTAGADTLFAWDSGAGPATGGDAPALLLSLGPPPVTPPPLPTQALVVATLTPTPENVLTVAANLLTATAVATTIGTYTPTPANVATPTPIPANLATVQAIAYQSGLPPVVEQTPTPANAATATMQALYATAVALTTGTFTPVPTTAVTPVLITATPTPADLAAAVAYALTATAQAQMDITSTPWPYNALVPTATRTPWFITPTPHPANGATATAQSFYATAVALTTGTFTPLPPNAIIIDSASGTPIPRLFRIGQPVVVAASQRVNLRSGPGTNFKPVGALNPGTSLEIIGGPQPTASYTWWQIRFTSTDGLVIEGWIADFLIAP